MNGVFVTNPQDFMNTAIIRIVLYNDKRHCSLCNPRTVWH